MLDLPKLDLKRTEKNIENFIKKYVDENKKSGVVLGISGGLDSACVATLSARALGPEKVLGVQMHENFNPLAKEHLYGNQTVFDSDLFDAQLIIKNLRIKDETVSIGDIINDYKIWLKIKDENAEKLELGNIKARTRMTILYYYANKENKLVAGTGDKSEILTGYFTKYGDGGVDILPIGNLYKTYVRELSKEIGVPEKIIKKPSSPGFWKGQTAEDELGIKYETLDKILYNLVDRDLPVEEIDYDKKTVEHVKNLIKKSAHKRDPLPKTEVVYREH